MFIVNLKENILFMKIINSSNSEALLFVVESGETQSPNKAPQ
jgi:hypothetical protein